jgi:hypothetical protein
MKYTYFFLPFVLLFSCKTGNVTLPLPENSFSTAQDKGVIENPHLIEASGMVASRKYFGYYWSHNDSGNPNVIYLVDSTGKGMKEVEIKGAINRDWEDISLFVEKNGTSTIFIGDFGDNNAVWPFCTLYWVTEPDIKSIPTNSTATSSSITFTLPDGSRDVECMLVDQITKDVYLISKRDAKKRLYKISASQLVASQRVMAEYIQELNVSIPVSSDNTIARAAYITSGTISPDNSEIIIKSYTNLYYWRRKSGETIPEALARPAKSIDYLLEPQGEAVGFNASGNGFVTLSESFNGIMPHVYEYLKK